jgi:uncharacterized OsmC-like protein
MSRIRQAIESLGAAIAADPSKARAKRAPATARLVEGLRCEITGPYDGKLATDMPPAIGGAGTAPSPGWLFRGALASCTATLIAMRAAKLGVTLTLLEVTADTQSDHRINVRIAGDAPSQTLREIAEWADAHSPVGCTVRNAPAVALEVQTL